MTSQVSTKLSKKEIQEIRRLVKTGLYINTSDFVRDAIRKNLSSLKEVSLDDPEAIEKRVYHYFRSKGGAVWPDDAARDLGYSVLTVLDVLEKLRKKGKAKESKLLVEGELSD
jgi:Arc/MetJ-type ribon-helix-helix transcriptional regulator